MPRVHFCSLTMTRAKEKRKTIITFVGQIPYKYLSKWDECKKNALEANQYMHGKNSHCGICVNGIRIFPLRSLNKTIFVVVIRSPFDQLCFCLAMASTVQTANSSIILLDKLLCQCRVVRSVTQTNLLAKDFFRLLRHLLSAVMWSVFVVDEYKRYHKASYSFTQFTKIEIMILVR